MSQEEIYNLLVKQPRLSSREIAIMTNRSLCSVSCSLKCMLKYKEVIALDPDEHEKDRILTKFPKSKRAASRIKVFAVTDSLRLENVI